MHRQGSRATSTAALAVVLALAGAGLWGCADDPMGFARVERVNESVGRFERQILEGKQRIEFQAEVGSQTHPELLVNWTNINREIEVAVYVVRSENYDSNLPPSQLDYFWSSVPEEGPNFGERRPTLIHLHPEPGDWVIIFYNPNDRSPATRALLSATIEYSYYAQI